MVALAPASAMFAQDASSAEGAKTITVIPNPVVLPVVVRDKKGAFVEGLTKDDFTLTVDDWDAGGCEPGSAREDAVAARR